LLILAGGGALLSRLDAGGAFGNRITG